MMLYIEKLSNFVRKKYFIPITRIFNIIKEKGKKEMGTGISINEIKNEYLQKIAKESDVSKDNFLDETEISLFMQKAQEQKSMYSEEIANITKLFETDERAELSWGEIGKIGLKSVKNFVKGLFCNKEGKFSIGKTLATVGVGASLALAAPVAAALGASAAVVGAISTGITVAGIGLTGCMVLNGGKNIVKGTKDYYNAETKEEAVKAMEQAMGGAVEIASLPVMGGLIKTGSKLLRIVRARSAAPKVKPEPIPEHPQPSTKPVESTRVESSQTTAATTHNKRTKPKVHNKITEETKFDPQSNMTVKTTKYSNGSTVEKFYTKSGRLEKEIIIDQNGIKQTIEYKYDANSKLLSKTEYSDPGYYNSKGTMKEYTYEKGLEKEVCYDGDNITTTWRDYDGTIVKQEFSTPNAHGVISTEKTKLGRKDVYADGQIFETRFNGRSYDYITTQADGTIEIKPNALSIVF